MNEQDFNRLWSDRASRYPDARALPSDRTVHIHIDPEYARTYAGQVAAITAASLIGRMSQSVAVHVPCIPIVAPLPWEGTTLDNLVMQTLDAAHRYGHYEQREARAEDVRLVVGSNGDGLVAHGCGWGAYRGNAPSPFPHSDEPNPFGAAFAVVAAAAQLERDWQATEVKPLVLDTYLWQAGRPSATAPKLSPSFELGELWCIGVGSVGSCALFFLSLITRAFGAVLVDRDSLGVENVSRSAMFSWQDASVETPQAKVDVAVRWLHGVGVERVEPHVAWLHEIPERWYRRLPGTPDVLISAANEKDVRSVIENAYPPLQVYATTGRNWQATLFRHIPLREACSLCGPRVETTPQPALCATGRRAIPDSDGTEDDVALPFLSYAAGLMTATEIAKLAVAGGPVTPNRVFFEPRTEGLVRSIGLRRKLGCSCQMRDTVVHAQAIQGSWFASTGMECEGSKARS